LKEKKIFKGGVQRGFEFSQKRFASTGGGGRKRKNFSKGGGRKQALVLGEPALPGGSDPEKRGRRETWHAKALEKSQGEASRGGS